MEKNADTPSISEAATATDNVTTATITPARTATDSTATTDASMQVVTRLGDLGHPKHLKYINHKLLRALKPGKERQAYLKRVRKRHGVKKRQLTAPSSPPVISRPWLRADADTLIPKTNSSATMTDGRLKRKGWWPKGVSTKSYRSLKPGRERQELMDNYRKKHGLESKSAPKKPIPTNFAWPKGMNREEFLAKKPGRERMAYLARYIKKNGVELEKVAAPIRVPLGRKPEPLSYPHCGCSSSEACASCSRCVELHCVCGLTGRRRRALCQESRACSCTLIKPTMRCALCHGCRQPHGFSHCRCVLHQRLLWIKRHPELDIDLTKEEEKAVCNCFVLMHRHGGAATTKEKEAKVLKEIERVRRIKRATGFPTSDNIYRSKKITTFLGDEGLESDYDDGLDDGLGSEVLPPSTKSVVPRTMIARMVDAEYHPASYHDLFRSEGCTLLEGIEPRNGRARCRPAPAAFISEAMQDEICRGLENYVFELDRNATMPPDDLVDYLVYVASIKASNIGELIGTFEDSAAVAMGIVIEEYMTQLIEDHVLQQQALCLLTKANVQAFTREMLVGFNWQLFQDQHPYSCSETVDVITALIDKKAILKDKLATLILHELITLQPRDFNVKHYSDNLFKWIRKAVVIPLVVLTSETSWQSSSETRTDQQSVNTSSQPENRQENEVGETQVTPQIRMAVKASPVHGNPSYSLRFAATLEDGHHVEASVGGLDSKIRANAMISQLAKVVRRQEERSMGTLKDPPPAPGPPPVLHPPPSIDQEDPYASMLEHVWEHFNGYALQKWQASVDMYFSSTLGGQQDSVSSQGSTAKRRSTRPPPGATSSSSKKRRGAFDKAETRFASPKHEQL
ncbi:hypothetical protein DD237_000415 [Peronospora effusa]|uniref:Uncharacterized protein n=1 Tax=Peronospora effusa TaxID=542832 RepID=A0A3R7WCG2_9STRA|nr:hypothetical protein DD237_000415 [Peronospora effusa]